MTTPHEPSSDYIRFDEIEDVVVSAELVAHLAPLLDAHPSYWKWVIVAAHNGAMVCALADSTGTSALDESAKKVLDWLNAGMSGDSPDESAPLSAHHGIAGAKPGLSVRFSANADEVCGCW